MKKTIIVLMALAGVSTADDLGYTKDAAFSNDITFTGNPTGVETINLSSIGENWNDGGSLYWGGTDSTINITVDKDCTPWRIKTADGATIDSLTLNFAGDYTLSVGSGNNRPFAFSNIDALTINLGSGGSIETSQKLALSNVGTLNVNFGSGGSIGITQPLDLGGNSIVMNFTSETALDNLNEGLYSRTLISSTNVYYSTGAIANGRITLSDALLDAAGYTYKGVFYADADGVLYTGVTTDIWGSVTGVDKNTSVGSLKAGEYALVMTNNASSYGLMANIVPEPTTATLSLLALAGLAARRRRK